MNLLEVPHVALPDAGGGHAVADQVHGQECRIGAAQKAPEGLNLAGHPAEEDLPSLLQSRLHLAVNAVQAALHVLCPLEALQLLLVPGLPVDHSHMFVIGRAVHHAPLGEHVPGQNGEHAPGGAAQPEALLFGPGPEVQVLQGLRFRAGQGTHLLAPPAGDAPQAADLWIEEPLPVPRHADGVLGADIGAGAAPAAAFFSHVELQSGFPLC